MEADPHYDDGESTTDDENGSQTTEDDPELAAMLRENSIASSSSEDEDDGEDDYLPRGIAYELIPIDHGYTLPGSLSGLSDAWPEWMFWPQVCLASSSPRLVIYLCCRPRCPSALLLWRTSPA